MSNLVKRLRMDIEPSEGDMEDAADLIEAQAARIADLEVAINAVHRHAMAQSGDRTFDQCSAALGYIDDICRAALAGGKDE